MNILAMDTSNQLLGVAIVKDGVTLGEHVMHGHRDHSVRLLPAIEQLMKETKTAPADLDRIVVGQGPGSYTGVRISMATAKTMAWALGIDVIGVSSLEGLASQGELFPGYVCPFFDARRGRYIQPFTPVMRRLLSRLRKQLILFFGLARTTADKRRENSILESGYRNVSQYDHGDVR